MAFLSCVDFCDYGIVRKLGSSVGCPLSGRYIFGGVVSQERETQVRNWLMEKLGTLFDIKEEVKGSWPLDNRPLRLDLLLRPNEKARQLGFDVDAIGIEIKDPQSNESVRKLLDCVMQLSIKFEVRHFL